MPLEVRGKVYFLAPDRYRSETTVNDKQVITIRKGATVQRSLPNRREVWRYSLKDLPGTQTINFATADLRDPFFAVDEDRLGYGGMSSLEGSSVYNFYGRAKRWAKQGSLDTRKGFRIPYQPKDLEVGIRLSVDAETGLLRRMIGQDKEGKDLFVASYANVEVNVSLDESLFSTYQSTSEYRVIDITDTMLSAMNPDSADLPPSPN
jgi:outer membrane lipoprotein-sorting protein